MSEQTNAAENGLLDVLNEELESFISVLQFSEKFLSEVHSLPVNIITRMVDYRQEWIEKIQMLEEQRKSMAPENTEEAKPFLQEISKIAEQLVHIDDQIFKKLQQRKLEFIREHSEIVEHAHYQRRLKGNRGDNSRSLDILQE